jgi:hypothetical protein
MITEHQYQRLMKKYAKCAVVSTVAMKAGNAKPRQANAADALVWCKG